MCVRTHVLFNSYLMYVTILTHFLCLEPVWELIPYYICIFIIYASSLMNTAMVLRRR